MTVCCTFPGKYGDLLWALPTVRAISRRVGAPVDLFIGQAFRSIAPLIELQPYIGRCAALTNWTTFDTAPISPRVPPEELFAFPEGGVTTHYDVGIHLGYRRWPEPDLARHTFYTYNETKRDVWPLLHPEELALDEPWITLPPMFSGAVQARHTNWICGFTDEYFELKYGVWTLLRIKAALLPWTISTGPRWQAEGGYPGADWMVGAQWIAQTRVVLADCSAWHVLAVAMGKPVILMEPQEMRWNPIFYPLGQDGPQVTLVKGIDGRPTFDARHVADALERALAQTTETDR